MTANISVYKCFDEDGALLYVGVGDTALVRIKSHQKEKAWFDEVVNITISKYEDRATALAEEIRSIREDKPVFNKLGKENCARVYMETYKLFMRRMKFTWVQISTGQYYFFKDVIDEMIELKLLEREGHEYSFRLISEVVK